MRPNLMNFDSLKCKIFQLSWSLNINKLLSSLDFYISLLWKYGCLLTIQDISIIFHHHWYIYSITIIPSPTNTLRRKVCVMVNWTLRNEYHIDILFTILCVYNVEFPTAWNGISFMRQNMNINRKRNEKWYYKKLR